MTVGGKIPAKAAPVKSSKYLAFIRTLPCVISGEMPVEAAHLSKAAPEWGHAGRGKGQKASDRWALPLSPRLHQEQHAMSEMAFWKKHGVDPHRIACVIWGLWSERGDAALEPAIRAIRSSHNHGK